MAEGCYMSVPAPSLLLPFSDDRRPDRTNLANLVRGFFWKSACLRAWRKRAEFGKQPRFGHGCLGWVGDCGGKR
jgi:hypothetical protein